jgi:flavin reductase (DIM6/NTAB) family NADH-FMN oxidoreductase RutF
MDTSTTSFTRDEARHLLTSVIVPRPVAWISTLSADHPRHCNLAPFSSLAPICNRPPLISFSCGRKSDGSRKDTGKNILDTGEFVVNFVGPDQLDSIAVSANEYDTDVDEFRLAGVTPQASTLVRPPRVLASLASLECRLLRSIELGSDECRVDLIIGQIIQAHARQELLDAYPASPHEPATFHGIGALGLDWYLIGAQMKYVPQPPNASPPLRSPSDS